MDIEQTLKQYLGLLQLFINLLKQFGFGGVNGGVTLFDHAGNPTADVGVTLNWLGGGKQLATEKK